jgi:hypothetical protein
MRITRTMIIQDDDNLHQHYSIRTRHHHDHHPFSCSSCSCSCSSSSCPHDAPPGRADNRPALLPRRVVVGGAVAVLAVWATMTARGLDKWRTTEALWLDAVTR